MSHETAISREGGRHSWQLSQMELFENDLPGTGAPRWPELPAVARATLTSLMALPQDAGDALLAYLERARPLAACDQVFLRSSAPYRPFSGSSVVSGVVRLALTRAGIESAPSKGANLLRHTLRMIDSCGGPDSQRESKQLRGGAGSAL